MNQFTSTEKLIRFLSVLLFSLLAPGLSSATESVYEEGDLIFHESRSAQSRAIQEATGSPWSHVGILFLSRGQWVVAEAVQPVRYVSLASFKARGQNGTYRIYRLPGLTDQQKMDLRTHVNFYVGRDYDIYFEWSEDLIYCSELVYKTFLRATGIGIGRVEKFRDLKLSGPYVQELIRRRLRDTGRVLDPDEPIVTPASQQVDLDLKLIERSEDEEFTLGSP